MGVADDEIDGRNRQEDAEGLERRVVDELAGAGESSTKPMMEVMEVFFTTCTAKPVVGGRAMRRACGRMMCRKLLDAGHAEAFDASHWGFGTASMQPRQMSPR